MARIDCLVSYVLPHRRSPSSKPMMMIVVCCWHWVGLRKSAHRSKIHSQNTPEDILQMIAEGMGGGGGAGGLEPAQLCNRRHRSVRQLGANDTIDSGETPRTT
ncbi:hypothetical protein BaRGS_00025709 [Batillaria attramentaria]|uniref:Uncharacterized protein n=1 Tax=Batillaria attramentaria TaxID=370345 RepID=A0ABD0K7S3_9CAEN